MTNQEIFTLISEKRTKIDELVDPTSFVLNKEVEKLNKEIEELQQECTHKFTNGVCEYCGKETDNE